MTLSLSLTFVLSLVFFFIRRLYLEHRKLLALQKEMLRNEVRSREVERRKIGEDLHDELGPILSYARMLLSQLHTENKTQTEALSLVEQALQESLSAVRTMSFGLVPPDFSNKTLEQAVNTLCERLTIHGSVSYSVEIDPIANTLPEEKRLHLYRIVQELVHNSIRHSGCSRIEIKLQTQPAHNEITLTYDDNGRGLDTNNNKLGIGMINIRNRASLLGGIITFPEKEKGFGFLLKFPLKSFNESGNTRFDSGRSSAVA